LHFFGGPPTEGEVTKPLSARALNRKTVLKGQCLAGYLIRTKGASHPSAWLRKRPVVAKNSIGHAISGPSGPREPPSLGLFAGRRHYKCYRDHEADSVGLPNRLKLITIKV
jgi:hypothetical protein